MKEHQGKVEQGRELVLVRTWDGGWNQERKLKKLHNNRLLCPACNPLSRMQTPQT
ncbi:hypothetical protein [Microcoleus sp. B4-D4]|uniref:hypothetical protein n=1 Tax=Microcoleus sp. B4-D4 TaxID=2818667 RepID=UPI002FD24128